MSSIFSLQFMRKRTALSFSFLTHFVVRKFFSVFSLFVLCFPFKKTMLNVKLEVLHITCKYTGPQECKNNILCKGRKKVWQQKLLSLK